MHGSPGVAESWKPLKDVDGRLHHLSGGLEGAWCAVIVATRPQFERSFAAYCFPGSARVPAASPRAVAGVSPETPVRRDAEHHTRGRVCSPEFRSHRECVAPFSSPTGNAAVPFSAKWRAAHRSSLKAPRDLQSPRVVKIEISRRCWRGNLSVLARFFGGDTSLPSAIWILATPGSVPTSLDALVNLTRDHFGLGGLIEGDESPHSYQVSLVVLLISHVNHTRLLIFVHIEWLPVLDSTIELVGRQRSVKIALSFSLGDASQKAAFRERSPLCSTFNGTTSSQNQRDADRCERGDADCSRRAAIRFTLPSSFGSHAFPESPKLQNLDLHIKRCGRIQGLERSPSCEGGMMERDFVISVRRLRMSSPAATQHIFRRGAPGRD